MAILPFAADHIAAQAGFFEPQRKNHYQVDFIVPALPDAANLRLSTVRMSLPTEGNTELEMMHKNESIYIAGKRELEAGTFTLRDYVTPATLDTLIRWRRLVYNPLTGQVGLAAIYKGRAIVELTGPDGILFSRKWQYRGIWPSKVTFGEVADADGEVLEVVCNFRYDKAIPLFFSSASLPNTLAV